MIRNSLLGFALVGALLGCTAANAQQNLSVQDAAQQLKKAAVDGDAETAQQIFTEIGACRLKELNQALVAHYLFDHIAIEITPNSQQEKVTLWMNILNYEGYIPATATSVPYVTVTIDRCQQK